MRSDYVLYVVAIICFVLAGFFLGGYAKEYLEAPMDIVVTAVLVVLGLVFAGLGYSTRPKIMPPPAAPPITAPPVAPAPPPAAKPPIELTKVKGIGPTRMEQLKRLGVHTVEDLSKASAEELAAKMKLPSKVTGKWIEEAKKLVEESS